MPPNYNPPPLPKKKKKNVFCPTLLSTNLVALNWFARGSKSLIHVHCVPSLVYCSSHGTYSPHPVILIACDFPNTKCFCICMEWWKLSARCNAEAGNSQGEEIGNAADTNSARSILRCDGRYHDDETLLRQTSRTFYNSILRRSSHDKLVILSRNFLIISSVSLADQC